MRSESRLVFPRADDGEDAEALATPSRRFSLLAIPSSLPDDSCEADKREEARRLRDLRGRVKVARAMVAISSDLAETLSRDWQKAARFYTRFGITEGHLGHGTPSPPFEEV